MLFRAQTCRFDNAHIKLGNSLNGGQNRISHSGMAETRNNSDRLNRRDSALRPSVVFRKVTNGFRSAWGADLFAGVRSVIDTGENGGDKLVHGSGGI